METFGETGDTETEPEELRGGWVISPSQVVVVSATIHSWERHDKVN
jgi:hypothetical protein